MCNELIFGRLGNALGKILGNALGKILGNALGKILGNALGKTLGNALGKTFAMSVLNDLNFCRLGDVPWKDPRKGPR